MADQQRPDIRDIVETLLFISKKPLSVEDLDEVLGFGADRIRDALKELEDKYSSGGLQLIKLANGHIMATRPQYSEYVSRFLNSPVSVTLTVQALETLSIIAYKQPVTKLEIDNIRGVMSDAPIRTLLEKRLIKDAGKAERVGHPILYATTVDFLKHFGLHDLSELPPLRDEATSVTVLADIEAYGTENILQGGAS